MNFIFTCIAVLALSLVINNAEAKTIGLGVIIGGPTGISGNYRLSKRESIDGVWTAESGDMGDFSQLFDTLYNRNSSLSITQGAWTGTSSIGGNLFLDISASGTISGTDSNGPNLGCVFSSAADDGVNIIDPDFNVYEVNINITNCGPLNSSYSGLGFTSDEFLANDTLTISVTDNNTAILIEITL